MQYKTHILEFSDDYQSLQFPEINEDHIHEVSKVCMYAARNCVQGCHAPTYM